MLRAFFIFDVESIGLHGEGFAVGGGVFLENWNAIWDFQYCCPPEKAFGSEDDRKWVEANVPAMEITHRNPFQVRAAFWEEWKRAKEWHAGVEMAVECGWPVEARFLAKCVQDGLERRKTEGPYPLHEISSFMSAAGMNPMAEYPRMKPELPKHTPLADARQSARLLSEALARLRRFPAVG